MSLTKDDLQAIRDIIDSRFEDFEERLKISMEQGLQETRDHADRIEASVNRLEASQHSEIERNDNQDAAIVKMRKALHAA